MAIAFDAIGGNGAVSTTGFTWSHTCTGSNRILIVGFHVSSTSSPTAVTYNAVNMTLLTSIVSGSNKTWLYYLVAPATGANNVSISFSGTQSNLVASSTSYTGVNQTTPIDNSNQAATDNVSLTVLGAPCWIVGAFGTVSVGTPAAGAGFTKRVNGNAGGIFCALEDSNGVVSTGANIVAGSAASGTADSMIAASLLDVQPYKILAAATRAYVYTAKSATLMKLKIFIATVRSFVVTGYTASITKVIHKWLFQTKHSSTWTNKNKS